MLLKAGWQGRNTLTALCGGEALDPGLAEQLCARTRRLWNCYGPTEATVWSLVSEVIWPPTDGQITISHSLPGYRHWVLDEAGQPVAEGSAASSASRARPCARVLAQAGLDQRSLPAPCHPSPLSHRRSGAAAGADSFLYLGRRDDQVKLRGFRIELGEVEAGLRRQAGVQEAAVRLVGEGTRPCWWATWRRKAG